MSIPTSTATEATGNMRIFVRSITNGQSVPISVEQLATLLDLSQLLSRAFHVNPSTYTLFFGAQPLQPGLTLAEQGVSDGCEIALHRKSAP